MFYLDEERLLGGCGQLGVYLMAAGLIAYFIETEYDLDGLRLAMIGCILYIVGSYKRSG